MAIRVILVEPEYSFNVGSICRVMANFGISDLAVVNPKCALNSIDAYRGAKHAKSVLEKSARFTSMEAAASGCDLIIGTTGIKSRNKGTIRGVLALRKFAKKAARYRSKRIALVFGREGIGLNEQELNSCDLLLGVETSPHYPVLNISHAAAIILYALSEFSLVQGEPPAKKGELRALILLFQSLSERFERRNMRAPVAFRRILSRSHANEYEIRAMLNLLRLVQERLDGQN